MILCQMHEASVHGAPKHRSNPTSIPQVQEGHQEDEEWEGSICNGLVHPNIAQCFDIGVKPASTYEKGIAWLVRECGDRGSLQACHACTFVVQATLCLVVGQQTMRITSRAIFMTVAIKGDSAALQTTFENAACFNRMP